MRRPGHVHRTAAKWIAKRAEVCELRRQGWSFREIAREKKCSLWFIQAALEREAQTGSHADRPRSGRPRSATPAVVKRTKALLLDRDVGSVRKVRVQLRAAGTDISRGTVHNIAHRAGLRSAVPIPRPKLTPAHRASRLAWATTHKDDDETAISHRVFADEKQFRVTDVSHRVWLQPMESTPIRETRRSNARPPHLILLHIPPRTLPPLHHAVVASASSLIRVLSNFPAAVWGVLVWERNLQPR
jgi:transposase